MKILQWACLVGAVAIPIIIVVAACMEVESLLTLIFRAVFVEIFCIYFGKDVLKEKPTSGNN